MAQILKTYRDTGRLFGSAFASAFESSKLQRGRQFLDRHIGEASQATSAHLEQGEFTMHRIRWQQHWAVIRRHRLFVILILVLGPLIGQFISEDRGFLFGWVVSILAVIWLWGEGRP